MPSKPDLVFSRTKKRIEKHPDFLPWLQRFLKRPPVSLRTLEYFVSSYAKRHCTTYPRSSHRNAKTFHVHDSYKSQIKAYSRGLFDAFRRRGSDPIAIPALEFRSSKVHEMETSLAQLNFLLWVYENDILPFVLQHQSKITKDIETHEKRAKPSTKAADSCKQTPSPKPKRVSISIPKGTSSLHLTFK